MLNVGAQQQGGQPQRVVAVEVGDEDPRDSLDFGRRVEDLFQGAFSRIEQQGFRVETHQRTGGRSVGVGSAPRAQKMNVEARFAAVLLMVLVADPKMGKDNGVHGGPVFGFLWLFSWSLLLSLGLGESSWWTSRLRRETTNCWGVFGDRGSTQWTRPGAQASQKDSS